MEVKVELVPFVAPFVFTKIVLVVFQSVLPANWIKVDLRSLFRPIFEEKGWFLKYLAKILAKKYIRIVNKTFCL